MGAGGCTATELWLVGCKVPSKGPRPWVQPQPLSKLRPCRAEMGLAGVARCQMRLGLFGSPRAPSPARTWQGYAFNLK